LENISLKLSPKSFLLFLFDKLIFVEVISILNNSLICLYYSMLIFKHIIKFKIFQSTQWCSIFIDFFNRKRRTCQVFPRGDGATTTTATETKTTTTTTTTTTKSDAFKISQRYLWNRFLLLHLHDCENHLLK